MTSSFKPVAIQLLDGLYLCKPAFQGNQLMSELEPLLLAGYEIEYPDAGSVYRLDNLGLHTEFLS